MAWDPEQLANARLIVAVGLEMGMSSRDITVGLMAAMQESSLRNLGHGDRDSLGLFQQRPSQGWGTAAQVTNPMYAARKFFTTLKGVSNRGTLTLWGAAQAVQRSGNPGAFARWEDDAVNLLGQSGVQPKLRFPLQPPMMDLEDIGYLAPKAEQASSVVESTPGVGSVVGDKVSPAATGVGAVTEPLQAPQQPIADVDASALMKSLDGVQAHASGVRGKLIESAQQSLGTPYVWGGSAPGGFDCSGLIYYWYNKLGVKVPRIAHDQAAIGQRAPINSLSPGDLVGFRPGQGVPHIAIYLGGGRILEAPHTGAQVRIRALGKGEDAFGVHLNLPGGGGSIEMPSLDSLTGGASSGPLLSFPGLSSNG